MQLAQSIKENITILHCAEMLGYHPVQRKGNTLSWTLQEHDSLVINLDPNGCQRFIWNSQRIHGSVIDFYMAMTGVDMPKAIQELGTILKSKSISAWDTVRKTESSTYHQHNHHAEGNELKLPEHSAQGYRRAYAYLIKTRCLDKWMVSKLFSQNLLYQDIRGNVVFVGYKPHTNEPAYASLRGTLSSRQYRGDVSGSHKEVGFYFNLYGQHSPTKLFVCESPIDAMSVASMLIHYKIPLDTYGFISLGGTSLNALEYHLKQNPQIQTVYLCQDNDDAGNHSRLQAHSVLEKLEYTGQIVDKPPVSKDFNEDLKKLSQATAIVLEHNQSQLLQQTR